VSSSSGAIIAIGVDCSSFEQPKSKEMSCLTDPCLLFIENILLPPDLVLNDGFKSGAIFISLVESVLKPTLHLPENQFMKETGKVQRKVQDAEGLPDNVYWIPRFCPKVITITIKVSGFIN
jgi:hypothetical protein